MRTLLVFLTACGTTMPEVAPGPRSIRTADHVEEARKHDEIARSRTAWPVTPTTTAPATSFTLTWDPDAEKPSSSLGESAANEQAFQQACGKREVEKPIGSPLIRHRVGGWKTEQGVVVVLGAVAGPRQTLLSDLRCYRSWLMAGAGVEKDSPLALPGLVVEANGDQDGITLTLTVKHSALIHELQRRVQRHVDEARTPPRHED